MSNSNCEFHGDGSSLSIEEANKIRLQLGLAPLEGTSNETTDQEKSEIRKLEFVHVPAINIGDKKRQEKHGKKLDMHREARQMKEQLNNEVSLGVGPVQSTLDFLSKVMEKKFDNDARKMQENDDNDSDSDHEKILSNSNKISYRSEDLSGLSIGHKASRFESSGIQILTLEDKAILDENDDILVNVNIKDHERAEKNVRNKKMGAYGAYIGSSDEDTDPYSGSREKDILEKYNEIDGDKRHTFTLDTRGRYNIDQEKAEEDFRNSLVTGKLQTFNSEYKIASDYFTPEELQARLKPRKRKARGMKTKNPIAAKVEPVEKEPPKPKKEEGELAEDDTNKKSSSKPDKFIKTIASNISSDDDEYRPPIIFRDLESSVVNDQLRHQLLMIKKSQPKVSAETRTELDDIKTEPTVDGKKIVLTKTEEYTKSIYNILLAKRKNETEVATQMKEEPVIKPPPPAPKKVEVKEEEEPVQSSGWQPEEKILSLPPQPTKKKRNFREPPSVPQEKKKLKLTDGILGDEVQINSGIFSTLLLAKNKGYLEEKKAKPLVSNPKNKLLRAQHFQEEKIRYDDIDQKNPRRDRRNLPETSFQDKNDFVPDIKLDYHDDFGRPQPPKEAFRALSHRFHGKTSGKIKSEKRFKKLQEQSKLKSSIGDIELKSVIKMQSKMKSENRYCVPLSGKNSIIPAAIKKSEKK